MANLNKTDNLRISKKTVCCLQLIMQGLMFSTISLYGKNNLNLKSNLEN